MTALIFMPLVALTVAVGEPFLAPTLASTAAIALATPHLFRSSWGRIVNMYAIAAAISIAVALPLQAAGMPDVVWAAAAGVAIAVSAPGRLHAPTACFPFALIGADSAAGLLVHGVAAAGGVLYLMLALRLWEDLVRGQRAGTPAPDGSPLRRP